VVPGTHTFHGFGLVGIGPLDAAPPKSVEERRMKVGGVIAPRRFSGRAYEMAGHLGSVRSIAGEIFEDVVESSLGKE
jgi:hypothetical protein